MSSPVYPKTLDEALDALRKAYWMLGGGASWNIVENGNDEPEDTDTLRVGDCNWRVFLDVPLHASQHNPGETATSLAELLNAVDVVVERRYGP